MSDVIDDLGEVGQHDRVTVELDDGSTVSGVAQPVTFDPNERLRIELRPRDGDERYELSATAEDGEWTPVGVRFRTDDAEGWEEVGEVTAVTRDDGDEPAADSASGADDP